MNLAPVLKQRFFDADGEPLVGGQLFTYQANSSTPLATYTDQGGGTENTNPVILDADGYADVWLNPAYAYKFVLWDADDNPIFSVDDVQGQSDNTFVNTNYEIEDGQAASALDSEVFDSDLVSSVEYLVEVKRGTELIGNLRMVLQWLAGPLSPEWKVYLGEFINNGNQHGLTFSMQTVGTEGQLYVAADTSYGDGTLKMKKVTNASV